MDVRDNPFGIDAMDALVLPQLPTAQQLGAALLASQVTTDSPGFLHPG